MQSVKNRCLSSRIRRGDSNPFPRGTASRAKSSHSSRSRLNFASEAASGALYRGGAGGGVQPIRVTVNKTPAVKVRFMGTWWRVSMVMVASPDHRWSSDSIASPASNAPSEGSVAMFVPARPVSAPLSAVQRRGGVITGTSLPRHRGRCQCGGGRCPRR